MGTSREADLKQKKFLLRHSLVYAILLLGAVPLFNFFVFYILYMLVLAATFLVIGFKELSGIYFFRFIVLFTVITLIGFICLSSFELHF
jgi:hypothetical protein